MVVGWLGEGSSRVGLWVLGSRLNRARFSTGGSYKLGVLGGGRLGISLLNMCSS